MVDTRPAELSADAALDAALDVGLRRLVYGTLAGLAAGAILFRKREARAGEKGAAAGRRTENARADPRIRARPPPSLLTPPAAHVSPLLLSGGPCTRGASVAFGAGFGLGSAYADSRKELAAAYPPPPPRAPAARPDA